MIKISLCMIVKNEERVLARCLDSLRGLMDEIIIVDTGSTDATKEIAAKYTDQIYDFTWNDDFAAARNFSFSKANMDYIYVADADEVLDEKNREEFAKLKQVLLPEIDIVQMYYCNQLQHNTTYNFDKEYRPKLYKRLREFQWMDPIHESVRLEPVVFDSDIEICHMPENNHAPRDFHNFQKMIQRGEYVSKKLHNLYARELMIAGQDADFVSSESFFEESIRSEKRSLEEIKEAAVVLAHSNRIKGNTELFFKYIIKDIVTEPCSESCFELGEFYFEREDYEEADTWYENAMEHSMAMLNIDYQDVLPRKRRISCLSHLQEQAKALKLFEQAEQYRQMREILQRETD